MYEKDLVLAYFFMYVGFAACNPWQVDQWDPELSNIIKPLDLDMEYDADQAVTFGKVYKTTDIAKAPKVKITRWDRVAEAEASFTAILFNYPEEERSKGAYKSFALPIEGYCGGVLATADTVITLCACVATWITWMRDYKGRGDPIQNNKKSLSEYDIPFKNIYVWFGYSYFAPWLHDWRVKLSTDPNKQIMNNYWCFEAIDDCTIKDHICQRSNPAVLKFDVPWSYEPETLVPWPPTMFYYDVHKGTGALEVGVPPDYKQYTKAIHYSYMFRSVDDNPEEFYDEFGDWLDLGLLLVEWNKTLVDQIDCVPLDQCLRRDNCKIANKWKLKEGITCFKGESDPDICLGSFGSPVYAADFGLHGLAMTYYPCGKKSGSHDPSSAVEVMAFTRRMADYIETLVPDLEDSSKEQQASHHLYRESSDYKMYEMVKYKFEVHDEKHRSEARKVKPLWVLNALVLVCFVSGLVL